MGLHSDLQNTDFWCNWVSWMACCMRYYMWYIYIYYISLKVLGPQKEWSLPRGPEWVHSPRVSQHCRGSTRRGSAEGSPRVRQGHLPFYHDHGPHDNCLRLCKLFSVRSCFALDLLSIALDLLSICSRFSICPRLLFRSPRLLFSSSSVLLKSYSAMLSLALDLLSICSRSLSICSRLLLIHMIMIYGIILGHVSRDSSQSSMASIAKGTFPGRSGTWKGRRMGTCRGRTFSGPKCQQFRGP